MAMPGWNAYVKSLKIVNFWDAENTRCFQAWADSYKLREKLFEEIMPDYYTNEM